MRLFQLAALVALASASNLPADHILWGPGGPPQTLIQRQASPTSSKAASTRTPDGVCSNGPNTRGCWANGYSIATDFDAKWPNTGRTVKYNLEITNSTCNPDGAVARPCLLFNGQLPGPTIYANWGDMIQVTVTNKMPSNGTSVHWHGIRQYQTNSQDGTNGLTECPLAPGDTKTYTFQATQFGTSWFHSHFSTQYGDGASGQIVINGPASANYDEDLGTFTLSDWYYRGSFGIEALTMAALQKGQPGPNPDNILVNGTSKSATGTGSYSTTTMKPGKRYRLRLINNSVIDAIWVSLDGHSMQVITADFVPTVPWNTNWLLVAIGQRYDVIITANQTASNYWFRANSAPGCNTTSALNGKAIFKYDGAPAGDPATTNTPQPGGCDEPLPTPVVPNTVPSATFMSQVKNLGVDLTVSNVTTNQQNIVFWGINMTAIDIDWEKPTIQYVMDKNTTYPHTYNLIELPTSDIWTYWIIQETAGTKVPIAHPMHLHGHDFYILGYGTGIFDTATSPSKLNFNNPTRRDSAILPARGWLAIAFPTDNPGSWLMHCHIANHISEGLGVQFLESKDKIRLPGPDYQRTCANWDKYWATSIYPKTDSGL
ncbi:putative multicopper oxidase, type 1 [Phyllosticta citriasiana]|uniref:laccase n=1 Tax=Phyllosticta citriasiana TaxID=595635 RepID=A0ABR1KPA4_9PEZI